MQDGDEPTSPSGNEQGEARESEQNSSEQDSGHPEKVYDFVHQHFGVALKSGGPESRAAEASGRNAVADKPQGAHSESWHALKSLIRYQSSTTSTNERNTFADEGSFGAQWNVSSSVLDDIDNLLAPHPDDELEGADQSVAEVSRDPVLMEVGASDSEVHADVEVAAHEVQTDIEMAASEMQADVAVPTSQMQLAVENAISEMRADVDATSAEVEKLTKDLGEDTLRLSADSAEVATQRSSNPGEDTWHLTVEPVESDENSACDAAEARSKFGSINAFQKMKSRTQGQGETRDEQATTGDMPETTGDTDNSDQWETIGPPAADGATIMNQWCSTSTGESMPSLAELDSIPTPSVMQNQSNQPSDKKSFSIKTPGVRQEPEVVAPPPNAVHSTARASWLQAASEYSASVIKAVTHQMMGLNTKPKKVTPESPEFHSNEPPEQSDDISSM